MLGATAGKYAVMVTASVLGLVVVRLLADLLPPRAATPPLLLAGGLVVIVTWADIAVRTAHIDDAIALAATVAALRWTMRDRTTAATLMFALAAAAKPWAVMFVPLALLPIGPGSWRRPIIAAGAAVATWIPFIVAEPDTLDTSGFEITNDPTSSLRAFGIDAATTPDWVRPAQLLGGCLLVGALALAGRWPAGLLAAVSWRLLLDPGVHRYYTAGFVIGALLVEQQIRPGRTPWFTIGAAIVLEVSAIPDIAVGPGQAARLAVLAGALAVAMLVTIPPQGRVSSEDEG